MPRRRKKFFPSEPVTIVGSTHWNAIGFHSTKIPLKDAIVEVVEGTKGIVLYSEKVLDGRVVYWVLLTDTLERVMLQAENIKNEI